MASRTNYYRPPRRIPSSRSSEEESRSKKRDAILFVILLVVISITIFATSYILDYFGLIYIAMGVRMFSIILIFTSAGVGIAVGITYVIMESFLKREFDKRFKKMEQEQQERLRQMMGYPDEREEAD